MASHIAKNGCRAAPAFHSSCGLWQIVVLFKAMGFGGNHASRESIESGSMCEASVVLLDVALLKIEKSNKKHIYIYILKPKRTTKCVMYT